jgi:hypothetical protein
MVFYRQWLYPSLRRLQIKRKTAQLKEIRTNKAASNSKVEKEKLQNCG